MASELLPCPFCGGEARNYGQADPVFTSWKLCRVACLECSSGTSHYGTPEAAAAAWNRRAPSAVAAEARDAALEAAAKAAWSATCCHQCGDTASAAIRALKGRA